MQAVERGLESKESFVVFHVGFPHWFMYIQGQTLEHIAFSSGTCRYLCIQNPQGTGQVFVALPPSHHPAFHLA